MLAIANIVLPIFALIIAGYFLRRKNILSVNACTELNRYVVWLALPALMIDVMINSSWSELYQPEFFYAFELGVFIIFFGVLAFHWLKTKNLANATVDATSASYANTGFIGLPLCALTSNRCSTAGSPTSLHRRRSFPLLHPRRRRQKHKAWSTSNPHPSLRA